MTDFSASDVSDDLERVYHEALRRLHAIREAWYEADQPLVGVGSTGQEVEHALAKLLRDSEAHVTRLGGQVRAKRIGRPQVAVLDLRQAGGESGAAAPSREGGEEDLLFLDRLASAGMGRNRLGCEHRDEPRFGAALFRS
jgi:hypothetical protein